MVAFLRTRLSGRPTDQREHVITVVPRTNRKEVTRVAGLPAQPASAVRAAMRFVPLACPLRARCPGTRGDPGQWRTLAHYARPRFASSRSVMVRTFSRRYS
jgi:hypothetical protein